LTLAVEQGTARFRWGAAGAKNMEVHLMRKLIIATTALAFLSSAFLSSAFLSQPAFAQDKAGDTMSKGDASKDKMAKTSKKSKKSSKMKSDDATK
jgi:hypothetical protein